MTSRVYFIAFLILCSKWASACDCPKITTLDQDFSNFKFVVYGVITNVRNDSSSKSFEGLIGDFQVLEVFKGSASSIKNLRGGAYSSGGSCMVKLEPGEYVVYSNEETAFVSSCNFSERVTSYSAEKKNELLKSLRNLSKKSLPHS